MSNTTSTIPAISEALQARELLAATRLDGFQRPTREQESGAIAAVVDSFKQLDSSEGIVALRRSHNDFRLLAAHLAQFADVREQVRRAHLSSPTSLKRRPSNGVLMKSACSRWVAATSFLERSSTCCSPT